MRICGVRRTDKTTDPHSFLSSPAQITICTPRLSVVISQSTMSLRSLCLCTLLLRFHPIFGPHALVASAAAGALNLYDDFDCNQISTLNPKVNLPLSTCLVTPGGEGLVIDNLPQCSQGNASLIYYQDTACGIQTNDVSQSIFATDCFQLAEGTNIYNAKSVMFSCQPAANHPQPSSTTTAIVSALAAVATGSTGNDGSAASTSAVGSTPTDTSPQKNSTGSSGSNSSGGTSTTTSGSDSGSGSGSGSGLSTSDKIAIGIGAPTGVFTFIGTYVMAKKYWWDRKRY